MTLFFTPETPWFPEQFFGNSKMLASKFYSFELLLVKAIIFRCFLSEIIRFPIFCVCSFLHFLCLIRALIFPTPTTAVKTTTNNRKRQR